MREGLRPTLTRICFCSISSFCRRFSCFRWLGIFPWNFQHIYLKASFPLSSRPRLSKYLILTLSSSWKGLSPKAFSCCSTVFSLFLPRASTFPSMPLSLKTCKALPIPFPIIFSFRASSTRARVFSSSLLEEVSIILVSFDSSERNRASYFLAASLIRCEGSFTFTTLVNPPLA